MANDDRPGTANSRKPPRRGSRRQTPDGLEQRLVSRARGAGFTRGDRVIVGFSGGRDSLALAAAMRWATAAIGIAPVLVHVDHQLRSTSGDEAVQAAALAAALGTGLEVIRVPLPPTQVHPNVGVEEAARRARYRILFDVAVRDGARAVATGHQQQDQAETVLLHLLRGGGVHGAAGMAERSAPPVSVPPAPRDISHETEETCPWLWRPLLDEPREIIDAYVERLGFEWIEDPSNDDATLQRNALRRHVLPVLEGHFGGATAALARYARLAAEDDRALEELALAALSTLVDPGGRLNAAPLREQPLALQRRMVRHWLAQVTGSSVCTAERTDALLGLAHTRAGGRAIEIGEGWTVHLERGMLRADRPGIGHEEAR